MSRLPWKRIFPILLTLILSWAAGYVWIYGIAIRKETRYRYRPAGIAELYLPAELPAITGFRLSKRNQLFLELSPAPPPESTWAITVDGASPSLVSGQYPKLSLLAKEHSYFVQRTTGPDDFGFTVRVDYFPRELYAAVNDSFDDTYRVVTSSLPVGRYRRYPVDAFVDTMYAPEDIDEARRILAEEIGISGFETTREKIKKIGVFVLSGIDDKRGIPAEDLSNVPMAEYQCALDGTSKIWCSQFANIYAFFANVAGIPTRFVSVRGRLDGIALSGHELTESFIAERGKWAYVDLYSRILSVTNRKGDLLNTLDLFMLQQAGVDEGLNATVFRDNRLEQVPYAEVADTVGYYFRPDATFVFRKKKIQPLRKYGKLEQALKIVVNPDLSYGLNNSTGAYALTVTLFYTTVAFLLFWFFVFFRTVLRRK